MTQFKIGDKVRVNEGLLEGCTGTVVDVAPNRTLVKLNGVLFAEGDLAFYTDTLVSADEPHEAWAHLKSLYPDFLKSDSYWFRITLDVYSIHYVSEPMDADVLKDLLMYKPPAGLVRVEFMLRKDDPSRGLAWKLLWTS